MMTPSAWAKASTKAIAAEDRCERSVMYIGRSSACAENNCGRHTIHLHSNARWPAGHTTVSTCSSVWPSSLDRLGYGPGHIGQVTYEVRDAKGGGRTRQCA